MAVPSKAGSVPKLSQLQASLRKSSAPKPGGAAPTQSLKRPAEDPADGAQAKKLAATLPSPGPFVAKPSAVKASITKQPSAALPGKPSGPGLQAKGPPPSPAMQVGVGTAVKSSGLPSGLPERPIMTKAKATPLEQVPVKRPPPVVPVSNGQQSSQDDTNAPIVVEERDSQALQTFVTALKGVQGKPKLILLSRLVNAISQDLSIEQSDYMMRLYRKRIIERAVKEGCPINVAKQPPAVAPAANVKQAALAPAAAVKSAPVKSAPVKSAPAPAATMSSPPLVKATASTTATPRQVTQMSAPPRPTATAMSMGLAAPPDSPPPSDPSDMDGDNPLWSLIGSLTEDPVAEDGHLKEGRLMQVLQKLWNGAAPKPRDWIAAWQAMLIPLDKQSVALQKFLNFAFVQSQGHERAPLIMAELVKAHKIKFHIAAEVLIAFGHNIDGILAVNEEAWHVYAHFFTHIHPQPKASGWGWSRVGWEWRGWWKFVENAISSLEASKASDVLCMVLRLVQEKEGTPLNQTQSWGPRLKQAVAKLAELGECSESEAISRLAGDGISLEIADVVVEGE